MAEKHNAVCSICNRPYHMCLTCKDMMNLKPWMRHTCNSEHFKIYQVIKGYNTGVYTKEETKSKLQMIDLSDFDNLRDNIKDIITDIMGKDEKVVEESIMKIETIDLSNDVVVSNEDVNDMPEEDINDALMSEKTRVIRKRRSSEIVETE